jgi:glucose-1-phosphate cytidylyltransferase
VKVVILCGGLGTRLREETEFRPKPMVDIGGRPILWHIMKTYAHYGFREFVLCLGYRGNVIKEYFLNYEAMNNDFTICLGQKFHVHYNGSHPEQQFQVTLADTGAETMTGGRVKRVAKYLNGGPFFLTYGDGVADIDIAALLEFHKSHGRLATVTTVPPVSRFGIVDINRESEVVQFTEKPKSSKEWASAGFFVLEPEVLEFISGDECIFEREAMEKLAASGQLMAYRHSGFFYAMDTYREYQALNELWTRKEAPWKVWQ